MKQFNLTYTENGKQKTVTQLHQDDTYIDDVYLSFDSPEIEIQHIELICQAEKTDYTVTEDKPYTVYKDGKTFSKGFNDITVAFIAFGVQRAKYSVIFTCCMTGWFLRGWRDERT